jgi:VanZ family protein
VTRHGVSDLSERAAGGRPDAPAGLFWSWGPVVVLMAAIFQASSLESLESLPGDVSDKAGHFAAYALLGTLALRATARGRWAGVTARAAMAAWAVCLAYGASDELHQRLVPGRTMALDDWVADAAGSITAIGLLSLVAAFRRRRPRRTL